jgi:hypothetical protein
MRYKKFLLIPILIFIYVNVAVDIIANLNPVEIYTTTWITSGGLQPVGVGDAVGIMVTRPYLFGLIRLPVMTSFLGNIGWLHNAFFLFLGALTLIFVAIEYWTATHPRTANNRPERFDKVPMPKRRDWITDIVRGERQSRKAELPNGSIDAYASVRERIRRLPGSYSRIKSSLFLKEGEDGMEMQTFNGGKSKRLHKEVNIMPEKRKGFGAGFDFRKLLKALAVSFGIGILHYFIAVMAAPENAVVDGGVSWALILLLMYLEYKL